MKLVLLLTLFLLLSMSHNSLDDDKDIETNEIKSAKCIESLDKVSYKSTFNDNFKNLVSLENAFKVCLASYIQIQTVAPAGNEELAVDFLKPIFDHFKIPNTTQWVESHAEGQKNKNIKRINLIATLPANRAESFNWSEKKDIQAVTLVNHMDVVGVKKEQWLAPDLPFSGKIMPYPGSDSDQEYLWGRGAVDMKGLGIIQMITMILLKKSTDLLLSDLHFIAVSDEESGGSGAIGILSAMGEGKEFQSLTQTKVILNEGGGAVNDIPNKGMELHLIGSEEKGGAWLEVLHRDPAKVLEWIYSKHFFNHSKKALKRSKKFKNYYCKIYKIETPKAKVNVVTSSVKVDLYCEGVNDRDKFIKETFIEGNGEIDYSMDKGEHIAFTLKTKSSSHGSISLGDSVLEALAVGLHRLGVINLKRKSRVPKMYKGVYTENTKNFITELSKSDKKIKNVSRFTFLPFVKRLLLKELEKTFGIDGLFRTKCSFSAFEYKSAKSKALVDCRLLHTIGVTDKMHAQMFLEEITKGNKDDELKVKLTQSWNVTASSSNSKEFQIIKTTIAKHSPNAVVVPYLFPAGSDNTWFRDPKSADVFDVKPILSFGYVPIFYDEELLNSVHGANERYPLKDLSWSLRVYPDIVKSLLTNN